MRPFDYLRAADQAEALALAHNHHARFLGGGTNLVDLMRQNIEAPAALIDVSRLPATIEDLPNGGLRIGAAVWNSTVASHPAVRAHYPTLSRALLTGASGQIRNVATVGSNILQRTRCAYFYDMTGSRCNKRSLGAGCDAMEGFHRYHAIFGGSDHCVATHPSDMCVALAALDTTLYLTGPNGVRTVPMLAFHRLPGSTLERDSVLEPDETDLSN